MDFTKRNSFLTTHGNERVTYSITCQFTLYVKYEFTRPVLSKIMASIEILHDNTHWNIYITVRKADLMIGTLA